MSARPLVIITVYNRASETRQMLASYADTTDLSQVETIIMDNASVNGAQFAVNDWYDDHFSSGFVTVYHGVENIGCPRALNYALAHYRKPEQAVIKLDNDIVLEKRGWLDDLLAFVEDVDRDDVHVAMVGAYYEGVLGNGRLRSQAAWHNGGMAYEVSPIIGHAVYHTGYFMDQVGYFDVLCPGHLYGFEDLIFSHKADCLGMLNLVWDGWKINNIQRHNSLGDQRDVLVEQWRPHYTKRAQDLAKGGPVYTGEDGQPRPWPLRLGR